MSLMTNIIPKTILLLQVTIMEPTSLILSQLFLYLYTQIMLLVGIMESFIAENMVQIDGITRLTFLKLLIH